MKICHFIPNLKAGGAQNFILNLIEEQIKSNEVVIVLLDRLDKGNDYAISLFNKIKKLGVTVYSLNRIPGKNLSILKSYNKAIRYFKGQSFDIINSHLPISHYFLSLIKWNLDIKVVITVHNAPEKLSFFNWYLNIKTPRIYCSESAFKLNKRTKAETVVIDNGILLKKQVDSSAQRGVLLTELGLPENCKLVVLVGAIRIQKNYSFVVDLVKEYYLKTDVHFVICGGYAGDEYLSDLSRFSHVENLHFLGQYTKVPELLSIADLYLSTSLHEGLPIALLEALFSGIRCVISPIEQHVNVADSIPYVFIPKEMDLYQYQQEITRLLSNNSPSKDVVLKSRMKHIERYNVENTSLSYINFYNKFL